MPCHTVCNKCGSIIALCEYSNHVACCIDTQQANLIAPLPRYCVWNITPPETYHTDGIELHVLPQSNQIDIGHVHDLVLKELQKYMQSDN
jgi:hypothetical protein